MKNPAPAKIDALIQPGFFPDLGITVSNDLVAHRVPGFSGEPQWWHRPSEGAEKPSSQACSTAGRSLLILSGGTAVRLCRTPTPTGFSAACSACDRFRPLMPEPPGVA